jgi:hypothetical protein
VLWPFQFSNNRGVEGEWAREEGRAGMRERERNGAEPPQRGVGGEASFTASMGGGGGGAELCTQTECHVSITIIFILIIFVSQAAANELFSFCPV